MKRFLPGVGIALLLILNVWVWGRAFAPAPRLIVTFLDVGQGDSAVMQTPGGQTLIVDAGGVTPEDDTGRRVVLPFLRSQGINRVDALLLTHPDGDHAGGANSVLEGITVRRLLVSPISSEEPLYQRALATARRRGIPITPLTRGQALEFRDGVRIAVLNPPADRPPIPFHADNNASLVLRLTYGQTALLLTGDAEAEAEADILRACPNIGAELLKLGHHGSRTSSSEKFLDAVHPQAALLSVGRRNVYGHPHPEILARLEARKIRVFRTDRDSAIQARSDGRYLWIKR